MNTGIANKSLDSKNTQNRINIHMLRYIGSVLIQRNLTKFIDTVFNNFKGMVSPELKHTKKEIMRVLTSPKGVCIIAIIKDQIVGYLIAEIVMVDENLRELMHIVYLYTSSIYRKTGIATYMINLIQVYAIQKNINVLSLTFDTYNKPLEKFYLNNHFVYDSNLRSYRRYDMLVKYI